MSKKISNYIRKDVLKLSEEGLSQNQIVKVLNISKGSVNKIINEKPKNNLIIPHNTNPILQTYEPYQTPFYYEQSLPSINQYFPNIMRLEPNYYGYSYKLNYDSPYNIQPYNVLEYNQQKSNYDEKKHLQNQKMNEELSNIKKFAIQKKIQDGKHYNIINMTNRVNKIIEEKNYEIIDKQIEQKKISQEKDKVLNEIEIREMVRNEFTPREPQLRNNEKTDYNETNKIRERIFHNKLEMYKLELNSNSREIISDIAINYALPIFCNLIEFAFKKDDEIFVAYKKVGLIESKQQD